ncbi:MAG: hypothetical protein KBS62_02800 [Oscillospiraceae bacterium]|nr:hypothetical protein [Candidatus Ruminococcus equi]
MHAISLRNNISKKLFLMYALNVSDWICTMILLSSGKFAEANPIARTFINSFLLSFVIKCILPFFIILSICYLTKMLEYNGLKTADKTVCFGLTFYIAINVDHLINFLLLAFWK